MTTYHHGSLRAAVLAAAWKMIEKQGVAGLSLREAARRAGVSHNAPYRHFPDREALLAALAAEGFELLKKVIETSSGRERGAAYVRFALENPQRFRLMFSLDHAEVRAQARSAYEKLKQTFAGLGAEADFAAAAAWSLVHGLAQLAVDGHLERNPEFAQRVLGAVRFAIRGK